MTKIGERTDDEEQMQRMEEQKRRKNNFEEKNTKWRIEVKTEKEKVE